MTRLTEHDGTSNQLENNRNVSTKSILAKYKNSNYVRETRQEKLGIFSNTQTFPNTNKFDSLTKHKLASSRATNIATALSHRTLFLQAIKPDTTHI